MFQSCGWRCNAVGLVANFEVIDSDFEEVCLSPMLDHMDSEIRFIIEAYEKRGLNVAANLALFLQWYFVQESVPYLLSRIKVANERYADEVKKYLVWI